MAFQLSTHDQELIKSFYSKFTGASPSDDPVLVTVNLNTTLHEALQKLTEHRIHSMPVVDLQTGKAVGIVSILDIMFHVLEHYDREDVKEQVKHTYNFYVLLTEQRELKDQTISALKDIGKIDPIFACPQNNTFLEIGRFLVAKSAHRVLITGPKEEPLSLVTQYKLVKLLASIEGNLEIHNRTIGELGLNHGKNVVSVQETEMARNAFQKMKDCRVSAVPVVNAKNELIGNVSASDLELLGFDLDRFDLLSDNCGDYLKSIQTMQATTPTRSQALQTETPNSNAVVKCTVQDTLGSIIKLILHYEVHRVYIVNSEGQLTGIISLGDILRLLF